SLTGRNGLAVGGNGEAAFTTTPRLTSQFLAGCWFPELDDVVPASRNERSAIARKGERNDAFSVTGQRADFFPCRCVPESDRRIAMAGGKHRSVGRERHRAALTVAGKRVEKLAVVHVPDQRPVPASCNELFPVPGKGHAENFVQSVQPESLSWSLSLSG